MINPHILFEDEYLFAIEKPAGIVVNNAESVKEETIEDWVRGKYQIPDTHDKNSFLERAGIVHRLDRETSGILLIAKNEVIFEKLMQMFKNRQVHKKYFALVHGITENTRVLNFKIARHEKRGKFVVSGESGKDSLTEFRLIREYRFNINPLNDFLRNNFERLKKKYDLINYSLIEVILYTGRTHQIRVHFSYIKHPVVGDQVYGWRKCIKFERLWCPRQFLHAARLCFMHPVTESEIVLSSKLPNDLIHILNDYFVCF